ncbi:MAG TPA: ADP-ribosylglycohydrolase family protein [Blastocatellia bacterium]|nr:ADP-ribosylglycohydrolase family protein [Blastocatellia bacterium]
MEKNDKIFGCLLGGAIGDAFGGAYENQLPPIDLTKARDWRLSDDTELTLATCEAIIEAKGHIEPARIAARFAAWHQAGRITGMGASTLKALTELAAGGHWALVGRKGERAAGNGAAMRIAPLAFFLAPQDTAARQIIRDVSRITHHHEEAYAGALAVVAAIRAALEGTWTGKQNLMELVIEVLPDTSVRDRLSEFAKLDLPIADAAQRFGNSGYVVESVPLAIYGAQQVENLGFAMMLKTLIAAGGDTDTIASMAGQIAGALLGQQDLPNEWLARLPGRDLIEQITLRLSLINLDQTQL